MLALAQSPAAAPLPVTREQRALHLLTTPSTRAAMLAHVARGAPLSVVLQAHGIGRTMQRTWQQRAVDGIEPYSSFAWECSVAANQACLLLNDNMWQAAQPQKNLKTQMTEIDWKLNAHLLARMDAANFGAVPTQVEVKLETTKRVDVRSLTLDELAAIKAMHDRLATPADDPGTFEDASGAVLDAEVDREGVDSR